MYAKIHYEPPKGGAFAPPLPPLNPPLGRAGVLLWKNDLDVFRKQFYSPFHAIRDTDPRTERARGPGCSPRLEATVHTCTVHANLGPCPGSTEYSVPYHISFL